MECSDIYPATFIPVIRHGRSSWVMQVSGFRKPSDSLDSVRLEFGVVHDLLVGSVVVEVVPGGTWRKPKLTAKVYVVEQDGLRWISSWAWGRQMAELKNAIRGVLSVQNPIPPGGGEALPPLENTGERREAAVHPTRRRPSTPTELPPSPAAIYGGEDL